MMRRRAVRVVAGWLAMAAVAAHAPAAWGWGAQGHRLVAEIAEANVTPATRAAIDALMRARDGLGTPQCAMGRLADAAVWPDCVRSDPARWAPTFPWHYQDAPVCAPAYDPLAGCADGQCVTAQIPLQQAILADRRRAPVDRLRALAFLAHFIGDIHQPFHAADAGDHGGNAESVSGVEDVRADGGGTGRTASLHLFWDDVLVARLQDGPDALVPRAYSARDRARLAGSGPGGDARVWAAESWRIAHDVAYPQAFGGHLPCSGGGRGKTPSGAGGAVTIAPGDAAKDVGVVRRRLVQAGLRLAAALDAALGR